MRTSPAVLASTVLVALAAPPAAAQGHVTFSVDWHSPSVGLPDSFTGTPITAGDVLTPVSLTPVLGPLPLPGIWTSAGLGPPAPGLAIPTYPLCAGVPTCQACPIEVDAYSAGLDRLLLGNEPPGVFWFSVDAYGWGLPGPPIVPNLLSEGPAGGIAEAPADVWIDLGIPPGPVPPPPFGPIVGHVGAVDGNGLPGPSPFAYPGLGLIEPSPPTFVPCDPGDNLDALNAFAPGPAPPFPVYYSLDTGFPDPNGYPNAGSAFANGFVGGDVLVSPAPGVPPVLFAPAAALGLDLLMGFDSDDLDALMLAENGTGAFEPSLTPYDWIGGATDMLLFSVRRGSAVIGAPDSIFGMPIEPGDILTTPLLGGLSPYPGILVPAEALGLATVRFGAPNPLTGADDLDALSSPFAPFFDCDLNGIEDAIDIAFGTHTDVNLNGIPDVCELVGGPYCLGVACPCGNNDPNAGCVNSTGVGALLSATGTSSVTNDDLKLTVSSMPVNKFGVFYMGPNQIALPFGDGLRCVGGGGVGLFRYNPPLNSGAAGSISIGPGLVAWSSGFPPGGAITPGSTWQFQCWYRDPFGPCGQFFNLSNGYSVTFTP
ncbi:MAG: hypothetical protein H6828_06560 [Planctomycetes bacterium]|nr:hypothetical protein [Planctomycetota bacterium]